MGLYQKPCRHTGLRRAPGVRLAGRLATQWTRVLKAGYHRRRGRLVLFDRYCYDARLPSRVRHGRRSQARRWLLAHACPPPDLAVLLDAPSELLYARKGEHDVALLEKQREAFRTLLPRLPRALAVDASREADEVRRVVTAAIWREYAHRWNRGSRVAKDKPKGRTETCAS
jgi:thymidylate kinase